MRIAPAGGALDQVVETRHFFALAPLWPARKADERSYTDPNARCPVCRAPVFFYQSPNGGRVFFDELGPPWPKHPCTDNPRVSIPRLSEGRRSKPSWELAGWEPVTIERVGRSDDWAVLKLNRCLGKGFIIRVCPWNEDIKRGNPAHIKALNVFGFGLISYLQAIDGAWSPKNDLLAHRTLRATTPQTMRAALKGDAQSAFKTACATYRPWHQTQGNGKKYHAFVDLDISRQWMQKAAALGSDEARIAMLTDMDLSRGKPRMPSN